MYEIVINTSNDTWSNSSLVVASVGDKIASSATWVSNDTKFPTTAAADARYELKGQGGGVETVSVGETTYSEFEAIKNSGKPFIVTGDGAQLMYAGVNSNYGWYLFWGWRPQNINNFDANGNPDMSSEDTSWYVFWHLEADREEEEDRGWIEGWDQV